jgi:beta-glucanase (GH16 family)
VAPQVNRLDAVESSHAVTDRTGQSWSPDPYAHGGSLTATNVPIAHTLSPSLYRSQRVGINSFDLPVRSNGNYLVVLYFAELTNAAPGSRVFMVLAQGRPVATVDIARDVGALAPYHLPFTAEVRHRWLRIRFIALAGQPVLNAVAVRRVAPGIQLPPSRLVWNDEFNGPAGAAPNSRHWSFNLGTGWSQSSYYTDRAANASVNGQGQLELTARHGPFVDPSGNTQYTTSARITTAGHFSFGFGRAEARLQAVAAPGFVTAFWGLGSNDATVHWPQSGEIDPVEVRGQQPRVLVEAFHMPCHGRECQVGWAEPEPVSLAAGFHTYAIERAPGVVVLLVDGRQSASLTSADVGRGSWVFDHPFNLILNLLVGGWAGAVPANAPWPVRASIDWVRVYR